MIHASGDSGVLCEGALMSEVCGGELLPLTNLCGRESADCLEQSGVREASKLVLDEYGDNFDFLVMFTNFPQRSECGGDGYYCGVQNDTFGIGKRQFNIQGLYGSVGRLQGVINLFLYVYWVLMNNFPPFVKITYKTRDSTVEIVGYCVIWPQIIVKETFERYV